jgi:Flp pilus assembly protein TadG
MSKASDIYERKKGERGVTLLLAALTMFVVLAMAALAIDVATLYLAKSEAQRAADAAALAAARALVAAGVTGDPSNASGTWQIACTTAIQEAKSVAALNKIGGVAPSAARVTVTFPSAANKTDCSGTNSVFGINPQVAVSVQRDDLPSFFSRIWGKNPIPVSSSATAEAFNPSNSGSIGGGQGVPVAPHCVKPWIIPNRDPDPVHGVGSTLFDPTSGAISNPGPYPAGVIGEAITLHDDCTGPNSGCAWNNLRKNPPDPGHYVIALETAPPSTSLPSCAGSSSYEQNIEACNPTPFSCIGTNNGTVDFSDNTHQDTQNGIQCLIREPGADTLDMINFPTSPPLVRAGSGNPLLGTVKSGDIITASDSVITIPIYDDHLGLVIPNTGQVNIIGFMQAFLGNSVPGSGQIPITVLNIVGCGTNSGTSPIVGGGVSPIPVRLIHQ